MASDIQNCIGSPNSNLVSMFLECALYGVFFILFVTSTWLLTLRLGTLRGRPNEKRQRLSLLIYLWLGVMMFLCLSGVWVFSWLRLLKPELVDAGLESSLFTYADIGHRSTLSPKMFGRAILFVTTSKFSDMILTYRLWIIFCKSFRVMAFPYLVWIGYFVACTGLTIKYMLDGTISPVWLLFFITLSVCLNVYFTGSILCKVRKSRRIVRYGRTDVVRAMVIIIESAAIYTIWLLLLIVTTVTHANVVAGLLSNGVAPVAGIITMLVNVRVGLGWAWGESIFPGPVTSAGVCPEVDEVERWYERDTPATRGSEV